MVTFYLKQVSLKINEDGLNEDALYTVFIDRNISDCDSNIEGVAYVVFNENPVAIDYTLIQCDEDGVAGGFTRFNLNQATNNLTGNLSGLSVKFYTDEATTNEISTSDSYAFDADNPQPIYAKVTNDLTTCFDVSVLTLDVSLTQMPDFEPTPLCDELGSEDGKNTFELNDITTQIQTAYGFTNDMSYYLTFDEALLENNPLINTVSNTNPYQQTIYARAEDTNICNGLFEILLKVNRLPNIRPEDSTLYCLNRSPETITLNAGLIDPTDDPANYTYNWSNGATTYSIDINEAGSYSVEVSNGDGCTKNRVITVVPSNIATIDNVEIKDATQNNVVTVIASGEGIYEYSLLDENNTIYADFQSSPIFEDVKPGFYFVLVKDIKNNCGTTQPLKISVIGFPRVFSPNSDGFNDTWQVYGVSEMFQPNTIIYIFDRYAKLLKELSPTGPGWDGEMNGKKLPADDYWFQVQLEDGRIFKSHFTLKR